MNKASYVIWLVVTSCHQQEVNQYIEREIVNENYYTVGKKTS